MQQKRGSDTKRVLIIGNIANNGFLIGQILNKAGHDVDVLSDDYFHCMAYPEWENLNLLLSQSEQIKMPCDKITKNNIPYVRPSWFSQGNRNDAINYLISKRDGDLTHAQTIWAKLLQQSFDFQVDEAPNTFETGEKYKYRLANFTFPKLFIISKSILRNIFVRVINFVARKFFIGANVYTRFTKFLVPNFFLRPLVRQFYGRETCEQMRDLCEKYEEVVLFGPSAIWGFLLKGIDFAYFEHGTVRYASEQSDLMSIVLSRVYKECKRILVTNGDVFSTLDALPKAKLIPTVHPLVWISDETQRMADDFLQKEWDQWATLKDKSFLFCPVRQDWDAKGVDFYLRNIEEISQMFPNLEFVFTNWGADLNASKRLLDDSLVNSKCHWIDTMSRPLLITIARKSLLVLDQLALPHFGSTAPQVMSIGIPVVSSYVPDSTKEIAKEAAPIFAIHGIEDLIDHLKFLSDPLNRKNYEKTSIRWIEKWHNDNRILSDFHLLFEINEDKND